MNPLSLCPLPHNLSEMTDYMSPTYDANVITSRDNDAEFRSELERTKKILSKDDIVDSDDAFCEIPEATSIKIDG